MNTVLLVGPPRSGTTWIGQTLGRATDTVYVHEPDGFNDAYAMKAKLGRGLQIELEPGEDAPRYETLWRAAFAGGRLDQSPRARLAKRLLDGSKLRDRAAAVRGDHVALPIRAATILARPMRPSPGANAVVKSVHACLATEWIAAKFQPHVVVVERNPLNVLASWNALGHGGDAAALARLAEIARRKWDVQLPVDGASRFARRVMSLGVLAGALADAAARHPEWIVVRHEDACVEPATSLAALCAAVGLEYSDAAADYVRESNQPGERYATKRVTSALVDKWRDGLTADEVEQARELLGRFPAELRLVDRTGRDTS